MSTYDNGDWLEFPKGRPLSVSKLHKIGAKCLIEEKIDGERLALWKGHAYGRRESSVTFRRENKWDSMPDKIKRLARDLPVEGEIYVQDYSSSEVKTAINDAREGRETDLAAKLHFKAFRMAQWSNARPLEHRAELLAMGFDVPLLYADNNSVFQITEELVARLDAEARSLHWEGWMLKEDEPDGQWWKYKLQETVDLVVTGFKPGKGKYLGQTGALLCSAIDPETKQMREIAAVSGMDDATRAAISEKDFGRCVEVEFQQVAAQGRLRHPRFLRWRDDKPPEDCVFPAF